MIIGVSSVEEGLVEIIEVTDHPFYVGTRAIRNIRAGRFVLTPSSTVSLKHVQNRKLHNTLSYFSFLSQA